MKKLILILAILVVASPAFAALDVNIVKIANGQVQIRYTGADPCNLPRGFALAFEVNSTTADVCGISAYKVGESNSTSRGYGIYPARITFPDPPGDQNKPSNWGNPLADQADPGAGDQTLPSKNFVLEFASLYAPVHDTTNCPNYPNGTLCTLSYEPNGATSFTIKMTGEGQYRITGGATATTGVVFEDGTTADVNKSLTITGVVECFPGGPSGSKYLEWVAVGKPNCWCASIQPRQCWGDADGKSEGKTNPPWVFTNDLNVMFAAWNKTYAQIAGQTYTGNGVVTPLICADFTHTGEGKTNPVRVFTSDLNILFANWNKPNKPDPNCALLGY